MPPVAIDRNFGEAPPPQAATSGRRRAKVEVTTVEQAGELSNALSGNWPSCDHRMSFLYLMRCGWSAVGAETALLVDFVVLIVAFEPLDVAVAFEGEDVRRDAIEEPAVVRDHDGAAGEVEQRLFERAQRVDVEVVGRLVEQQQVAAALQQLGQVQAIALSARERADFLLLIAAAEVEPRRVGARVDLLLAENDLVLAAGDLFPDRLVSASESRD